MRLVVLVKGWAAIAGSMLVELPQNGGAGLTLDETTQMFGLAASVNYISPLFLGILLDRFGPRCCSVVSNSFVAVGCFVFAVSQQFSTFTFGICLVAFGGPGAQTSLIHLGNLFPERRFFVMGCVAETITLSFAIFPLMDVLWQTTQLGFRDLFGGLSAMVAVSAVCSFLLWPDQPYEVKEPAVSTNEAAEEDLEATLLTKDDDSTAKAPVACLQDASLQEQLTSGVFFRLTVFFLVTSFWANFYIAIVTIALGDQQHFESQVQHQLAVLLSFIDAAAIVCAPLSGYLLDSVGFVPTAFITILLGILQMILLLVAGSQASIMTASFVSYSVYRAFLFPYFFASLSKKIGFRYFGLLSGIAFCSSGITQLSIAPLAAVVEGTCHEFDDITETNCSKGKWNEIYIVQIVSLVVLLLIPILDYCADKKETKQKAKVLVDKSSHSSYGSIGKGTELIDAHTY
jgi:MFS family permease